MPPKQRPSTNTGFTIIETIIVMAIAGLILSIVLLAIPILERNSRNNQRKQDVTAILEGVSHYELNNSGDFPDTGPLQAFLSSYAKLTYYDPASITTVGSAAVNSINTFGNPNDLDKVEVYNHAKCKPDSSGDATNKAASYSDIVALYAIQTGNSGVAPKCAEL